MFELFNPTQAAGRSEAFPTALSPTRFSPSQSRIRVGSEGLPSALSPNLGPRPEAVRT